MSFVNQSFQRLFIKDESSNDVAELFSENGNVLNMLLKNGLETTIETYHKKIQLVTSDFSLNDDQQVIFIQANTNDVTVTLPSASSSPFITYFFVATDVTKLAKVQPQPGEFINNESYLIFRNIFDSVRIISKDGNWFVLNRHEEYPCPTDQDCIILSNLVEGIFKAGYEHFNLAEEIPYLFVDFFTDSNLIESQSDIEILDGDIELRFGTIIEEEHNCDNITYWSEGNLGGAGELTLDTSDYNYGTGSIKGEITSNWGFNNLGYQIVFDANAYNGGTNLDITNSDLMRITMKSTRLNSQVRIQIINDTAGNSTYFYHTFSTTDWEDVVFDISSENRDSVSEITIQFQQYFFDLYSVNYDRIQFGNIDSYASSGSLTSITKTLEHNIIFYKLLIGVHWDKVTNDTDLTLDISLDGGNHWKTNIPLYHFNVWVTTDSGDLLENPDSGSWDNFQNLKARFNLSTEDNSVSPILNDYGIIWQIKRT